MTRTRWPIHTASKTKLYFAFITILTGAWLSSAASFATCKSASAEDLQAKYLHQKVHVVFFASWCSSCAKNLEKNAADVDFYVAAFDEPKAANAVMKRFQINKPCYYGDQLPAYFGIKSLPASTHHQF